MKTPKNAENLPEIKAVAFDIDGTLYSNASLYIRIAPYFFKNFAFFTKYYKVRQILHRTAVLPDFYEYQARLLAERMKISNEKAKELIFQKVYKGLEVYFPKIKTFPKVKETFEKFKKAGLKLALLSDFPIEQKGDVWGTKQLCDVVLGSEQIGMLKPSIYVFGTLKNELNLPAENILYVGNSIQSDIIGAKNAGMQTAYIAPWWKILLKILPKQADYSFCRYSKLQKIVLK